MLCDWRSWRVRTKPPWTYPTSVPLSSDLTGTVSSRTSVPPASTVRRSRPVGLRGGHGGRIRKPRQVDARRVRDEAPIRPEDQDERVRCRQDRVLVVGRGLGVGRRSIVERGRGGIDARAEHAVDVDVECPEGHERGGGSDPDHEQRDKRERHDRQPPAGPGQEPGRRVRHPRVTTRPSGCSRRRVPCATGPRGRARRASAAGSGCTGPPRWSRRQAPTPRRHRGSGAGSGPARCGG